MVYLFYTTYISVDLAYCEIFHHKLGKDGINFVTFKYVILRSYMKYE